MRSTWWHRVRPVLAVALLVVAVWVGWEHRSELRQGFHRLDRPAWPWLLAACAVQASSMVVFARLQRWLLRCGGVDVRLRDMVEITLAGNALSTSLPGGAAWAAGWIWGQLRRRSVDRVLAGWVVLVAGALSSFALFLIVAVGAELAGPTGPVSSLRWVDRVLILLAVLAVGTVVALARSDSLQARWAARLDRSADRPGLVPQVVRALDGLGRQVRVVTPSPLAWVESLALALANWGADLATLVFCIWTVHAAVPWRGIVIAYALTQISASIPVTPGGLAVVEASLGALLVAYGMASTTAVTVVLLYRLISFWCLVPIGWASWGLLELAQRRGGPRRHPWAFHRHGPDGPDGPVGEEGEHRGPGRVVAPRDCEGCDEPSPVSVSTSHRGGESPALASPAAPGSPLGRSE